MTGPNENALTPASLATDGEQGEGAKAGGRCEAKHSPQGQAALFLARVATDAARMQLDAYALVTDRPQPTIVDVADLLDAAAERLAQIALATKGARGGDT